MAIAAAGRVDLRLAIDALLPGGQRQPLMIESDWDIELEGDRGITLASGDSRTVNATVHFKNRPSSGTTVSLSSNNDGRSPTVAEITSGTSVTDSRGVFSATVSAKDLNRLGNIPDPVTKSTIDKAALDRNYGNNCTLSIRNPLRRSASKAERIQLCVRVLHKIDPATLTSPVTFHETVKPLLGYHLRFFPWLHTRHAAGGYTQFLNLSDYASVSSHIDEILTRVQLPDDDPQRMPRSRDLPVGTIDVLKRWRDEGLVEGTPAPAAVSMLNIAEVIQNKQSSRFRV
jgi:hypothetical protein